MIGVLASGNGSNLQALIDSDLRSELAVVVCNKPGARALERAAAASIPAVLLDHTRYPDRDAFDRALASELQQRGVKHVVLAGFMRVIGQPMLDAFPQRIVNVHPSLLPSFPGLHAQKQALEAGVRISGCTVHLVDSGCDTGPILAQAAVPVLPGDDADRLSARILRREHQLLPAVVRALISGDVVISPDGKRAELTAGLPLPPEALVELGTWLVCPPARGHAR